MRSVVAQITQSLDGCVTGPDDGPGKGLGEGGERLHYWVFNGPWSYAEEPTGEPAGVDKEILDEGVGRTGAVIGGGRLTRRPKPGAGKIHGVSRSSS